MDNITTINLATCPLQYLAVGYVGETGARPVAFDFSSWAAEYGAGVLQLLLQRPGDADPYPVVLDIDGITATWTPDATATEKTGQGQAQLIYTVGGVVVKNAIFRVLIAPSLGAAGNPPEPYETWLERLTELAAETQQSAIDAAGSAEAAGTSAGAAAGSAGAAAQSAADAEAAKSGAESAETAAGQSATLAGEKATQATQAAQTAAQKATDAQQSAEDAAASATDAAGSAGAAALSETNAGGSASAAAGSAAAAAASVASIGDAGAAQIAAVNQAGATQVAAVEDKGEEVIASIPPDYTELAGDVSDLKSAIAVVTEKVPLSVSTTQRYWISIANKNVAYANSANYRATLSGIQVTEGDVCIISASTYGKNYALYALGDENEIISTYPDSPIDETGIRTITNYTVIIPEGITRLYLSTYATSDVSASCAVLRNNLAEDTSVITKILDEIDQEIYTVVSGDGIDGWKQGTYNATNGSVASSETLIRLPNATGKNIRFVTCKDGYSIAAFGFLDGNYCGMWKGNIHPELMKTADTINLRLRKNSGDSVSPQDAENVICKIVGKTTDDNPCDYAWKDEVCTFDKILCIGDSLIEGGANQPNITPNPENAKRTVTRGMYSVPRFLEKMFGVTTTNWGISGSTSRSWYNAKSSSEPDWGGYDCALIYIGSNDYNYATTEGMTIEQATETSRTYIGHIIAKLKTDNPGIRVFLCTLLPNTTAGDLAKYRIPLVEAIRNIADNDSSVFLIDMNTYSSFKSGSAYSNGHPTAIGYQWFAREIGAYMCWWIANSPDDFKWIRQIGTQYAVTGIAPDQDDDGDYGGDVDP